MKKKIAFYIKKFKVGGIETSLMQYLNNIDFNRFDVDLVIGVKQFPEQQLLLKLSQQVKIRYIIDENFSKNIKSFQHILSESLFHRICYGLISRPIIKLVLRQKLVEILSEYDCVIDYGLTLDFLVKKINAKVIGYFHFRISHHYVSNRVSKRYTKMLPAYYKIVVINTTMLNDAVKIFPASADKFVLLYNQFNIDAVRLLASSTVEDTRINEKYFLSIGRLANGQKDISTLIKAFKVYKERYLGAEKLFIIGDGEDKDLLLKLCTSLDLGEYVEFLGYISNPMPWLKNAKLFVLSSKFEGLANVLVEAMILGVPIISSNCPDGPSEVLLNGKAGLLVPVGDVDGFADGFNSLVSDSELCNKLLCNGKFSLDRFDITKNINVLQELF